VTIENRHFPSAWGSNKKEAEQKAAFNALIELGVLEKPPKNPPNSKRLPHIFNNRSFFPL